MAKRHMRGQTALSPSEPGEAAVVDTSEAVKSIISGATDAASSVTTDAANASAGSAVMADA